ncbi:Peptide-N4-N-acetyl-beta-glucosaminylasparagine amidase [Hondaea fermentalgiana]|uniref:Peptide-N4-N-acetyl-beta-glucosaminylasparagine amidase n=1 Tax=Hondaea fermentalgiana TaxID=2315210 RepID=A0A2R5GUV4_9STRA|nr:Peptide-N4-N-acetyl-beta-glucosaminylasparagine amidase [Hondaea fermentalgiana]|eukprot:GBG34345.1 Peptide-N4-N-acetyl-beta-glucosaminylasparagine amidase [Hondaea fermentalgiana]
MATAARLRVRFRGEELSVAANSLAEAQSQLFAQTGVPPERQKLVAKAGARVQDDEQLAGLVARGQQGDGELVQLFGSTEQEVEAVAEAEASGTEAAARIVWNDLDVDYDEVQREREHQSAVREREARMRTAASTEWRFHGYRSLPQFRDAGRAREILERLGTDPGFVAVMRKHRWKVGVLSEMYPDGKVGVDPVCVLGVNINKGQEISLRLRTDDLQGFRKYDEVKKVLCHELSHMVHSDHDAEFYKLMRQIEKEQVALDWRSSHGRVLGGDHFLNAALVAKPSPVSPPKPQGGRGDMETPPFQSEDLLDESERETVSRAVGQIVERNEPQVALRALEMISKVLGNIVRSPENEKFRRLRIANAKFKETIGDALGARHVLATTGWELQKDNVQGEDVLIFVHSERSLARTQFGLHQALELTELTRALLGAPA